jgi:hypothetical protein
MAEFSRKNDVITTQLFYLQRTHGHANLSRVSWNQLGEIFGH